MYLGNKMCMKNTILFWLFQAREEKREHKRRMKKLENIYKDNVRWSKLFLILTKGRGKKKSIFLEKSPKLWVGGGQES